jgi:uncharacterized cupredoxin-like copper-binding protein
MFHFCCSTGKVFMKKWLIVLPLLLLTACGGNTGSAGESQSGNPTDEVAAQQISLVAKDILYDKNELEGVVGQPIEVQFSNEGALAHDFTITEIPLREEAGADDHDAHGAEADVHLHLEAGESGSISFTPTEAGTYSYECTVPGHKEAGMIGTLNVIEAAQ